MIDVGFLGAFVGGVLSLLSPCSVMLLPAFFAYAFDAPATLVRRTGAFLLGLMATLVPLGVFAGSLGAFLAEHRGALMVAAALVVILLGALQVAGISLPSLGRTTDGEQRRTAPAVFVLGAAYGVAGVCTGPILGSVLMIAAVGANPAYGAILLAIYAIGMCAPLLVIVLLWRVKAGAVRRALAPRMVRIGSWRNSIHAVVAGALSIALGVALLVASPHLATGTVLPIGTQIAVEQGAAQLGSQVPNVVVIAVGVGAGLLWLGIRWWRRRGASTVSDSAASAPVQGG